MRWRLLLVVVAITGGTVLALPGVANGQGVDSVSTDPPGQLAPLAFSPGCGPCIRGGITELDVRSGASGENPTGNVSIHFGGGSAPTFAGSLTCLSVNGNEAVFAYSGVTQGGGARPFAAVVRVVDIAGAGSLRDTLVFQEVTPPGPTDCSSLPSPTGMTWYTDIAVHDAVARMVGKGSNSDGGVTAAYAYILPCDATRDADARFEARQGTNRVLLTSLDSVACFDDPAVPTPPAGFDTMTGTATVTLNGAPGYRAELTFVDGGPGGTNDSVKARLTSPTGGVLFDGSSAPPGKFPGSTQTTGYNTAQLLP